MDNAIYDVYESAVIKEDEEFLYVGATEKTATKVPKRFVRYHDGEPFILYAGLLALARIKGIKSLTVDRVEIPTEKNGMVAECKATLISSRGDKTFSDYGDASPISVAKKIVPHIRRMASTRAKARVLRDFLAIGLCAYEELDLYKEGNDPTSDGADPKDEKGSITEGQFRSIFRNRNKLDTHNFGEDENTAKSRIGELSQNEADKIMKELSEIWKEEKSNKNTKDTPSGNNAKKSNPKSQSKNRKEVDKEEEDDFVSDAVSTYISSLCKSCSKMTSKSVEDVVKAIKKQYDTENYEVDPLKIKVRESVSEEVIERLKKGTIFRIKKIKGECNYE